MQIFNSQPEPLFWKEEKNKSDLNREVKCPLFADDMALYAKDPKTSTKKLLDIINTFSKVAGYKVNLKKSVAFQCINNERTDSRR
jgi:hypothetical protein